MSNEYDVLDSCLVDGDETSTRDLLVCISQNLRERSGAHDFSRNVLLVYSAGKQENPRNHFSLIPILAGPDSHFDAATQS